MSPPRIAAAVAVVVILAAGGGYLIGSSISGGGTEQAIDTGLTEPTGLAQAGATVTLPGGTVARLPVLRRPPAPPAARPTTVAPRGASPTPTPPPAPAPPATTIFLQ